ncbi:Hypothetical protein B591_20588 [Streptomyces sp. GBA 94-10 4N24]|nr:hypothetical protein [Streptomyces sp. GBA 94-10 4N24]ESP97973.1 Hypothetical protein B591_20588 [Streptomyces sp. GBA 94-10 4N24]UZN61152.1 Hypothetical protein B591N_20588 [Streptomyces sp. GBA 94-10 4N24]
MPTAVAVTSPELVLPSPDRHTPPAAILQSAEPGERGGGLDRTLAEIHTLVEQHGHVLVVHPAAAPPALVHRLHAARAALETDRLALVGVDLPPLGTALLALQLRQLSICDFSPGVLASAARLLAHYLHAGAVLGSVARLDQVPVGLKAHAKSWLPGSQFAVLARPEPQLVRLSGDQDPGLKAPGFPTRLVVAEGGLPAERVTGALARAWHVREVTPTKLPAASADWWGTPKLTEFAAAIPDISVLYQLVSSVRREECHWCGLELIGDRCAFCAAPLPPPGERGRRALPATRPAPGRLRGREPAPALAGAAPAPAPAGRALPAARDPRVAPALDTGAAPPAAPQAPAGPTGGPATGVHALRPAQREAPADWGPHRPYEDPHQPPPPSRSRNPRP